MSGLAWIAARKRRGRGTSRAPCARFEAAPSKLLGGFAGDFEVNLVFSMIVTWGFTFGEAKQPLQTAQKSGRDGQIRPFFLQNRPEDLLV